MVGHARRRPARAVAQEESDGHRDRVAATGGRSRWPDRIDPLSRSTHGRSRSAHRQGGPARRGSSTSRCPGPPRRPIPRASATAVRLVLAGLVALSASGLGAASAAGADRWPAPPPPPHGTVRPPRPTDPAATGHERDVLRPRLRPRRRAVAVRRPRPRPRRPGRPDDPRPLLRAGPRSARRARRRSGPRARPDRLRRDRGEAARRSPAAAGRGRSTASPGPSRPTRTAVIPTTTFTAGGPDGSSWTLRVLSVDRRRPLKTATVKTAGRSSGRRPPPRRSQLSSKPTHVRTSTAASCGSVSRPRRDGHRRRRRSTTTCAAWSRPRCPSSWPAEALKAQAIAARSYAARRLHPTHRRYYDVYDDTRSQVYRGSLGETTADERGDRGDGRHRAPERDVRSPTRSTTRADGGATENNENVFTSPTGADRRRPGLATCAARATGRRTGRPTTRARRTPPGRRPTYTRRAAVGLVRQPTRGRTSGR